MLQVQNKDAGTLIGTGVEPYDPTVFMASSCTRGDLRYRITVEVKDGRYRCTIDGFTHEGGSLYCKSRPISFGLLTTDRLPPADVGKIGWGGGLPDNDRYTLWNELKAKARLLADGLAGSLRARLSGAATEKPW